MTRSFDLETYYGLISDMVLHGPETINAHVTVAEIEDMEIGLYVHLRDQLWQMRPSDNGDGL